jgi:hypothetical protein
VKPATLIGVALIILGVLALAYQGITYTTREKVLDLGPLKASVDKDKRIRRRAALVGFAAAGGHADHMFAERGWTKGHSAGRVPFTTSVAEHMAVRHFLA